jgi:Domain of unknown function (DUF4383)
MTYLRGHSSTPPIQLVAVVVAGTFLMVGGLGFAPGATRRYELLEVAGHGSEAELFGLFQISVLHNLVHLAFGVAGLVMAATALGARRYLIGGGAICLALGVYGMVVDRQADANVLPLNRADDWLHLGLGAAMVVLGAVVNRPRRAHRH